MSELLNRAIGAWEAINVRTVKRDLGAWEAINVRTVDKEPWASLASLYLPGLYASLYTTRAIPCPIPPVGTPTLYTLPCTLW